MPDKPVLKIFVHTSGSYIAAQEVSRKDGISVKVMYPAFAHQNPNGVGYKFEPFQFVISNFTLYTGTLIGENPMPDIMKPFYEKYMKEREEEIKKMP